MLPGAQINDVFLKSPEDKPLLLPHEYISRFTTTYPGQAEYQTCFNEWQAN
jgi:hypothetical protein